MYLKSLTLKGFKSFPKKIELDFEPGITMIVGPNGSGKSNVTDAIQWVLGEQSPSALRGSDMQDVIFAGSLNQKALNLAEVTLTLDNSDRNIDLDFSEVSVTRRILRSGENQYFINSTPCRLLDIYELLHDTGLGKQTHSLIGQGRLEEVVNSKPEEKRILLEEAAGVLKHKKRKERALRKLFATEDNLSRANDILNEINKQLRPLEAQVAKAHTYKELTQELKALEVAQLVKKLTNVKKRWKNIELKEEEVEKRLQPLSKKLTDLNRSIASEEEAYQAKAIKISEHQKLKDRIMHAKAVFEKMLSLQAQREQTIEGNNIDFKEQHDKLQEQKNLKEAQIANLKKQLEDIEGNVNQNLKVISAKRKHSEELAPSHKELDEDLKSNEARFNEIDAKIRTKESESLTKENDLSFIKKESEINKNKIDSAENNLQEYKQEISLINAGVAANDGLLEESTKELNDLAQITEQLKNKTGLVDSEISRNIKEKSKILGRQSFLSNLKDELEPNDLLEISRKNGINGEPIDKILKVKKKYTKAIESYLGTAVQGLIVDSLSDAKKMLVASQEANQKISVTVKSARGYEAAIDTSVLSSKSPEWLRHMLRDVVFVKALDDIADDDTKTYVTLAGEVYSNGTVRADYRVNQQGLLSLNEELDKNHLAVEEISRQILNNENKKTRLIKDIEENEKKIEAKKDKIQLLKEADAKLHSEIQFVNKSVAQNNQLLEDVKKAVTAAELSYTKIREEKNTINSELDELTKEKLSIEKGVDTLRDLNQKAGQERQANQLELTELSYQSKNLNQQQLSIKKQLQELLSEKQQLEKQSQNYINRFASNEKALVMIKAFNPVMKIVYETTKTLFASYTEKQLDTDSIEKLKHFREQQSDLSDEMKELEQEKQQFDVDRSAIKSTIENLADRIIQEHNIAIETALEQYSDVVPNAPRASEIKEQLNDIGPVNAIAEEQFKEFKERKEFLEKQINDLTNSKLSITQIIRAIDKKIKERLLVAFEEVSLNFKKMFGRLFPGGKAELTLTGENIFESGLEINAQPYGKSAKTLSLLSGGETALTALALLFAVYQTRPSPFYVLDEVEAALDDINLQRFIRLIKDMKTKTQFLVITHQRRTMEVADCLYGVTMQADGVSKVVSQKITEAKDEKASTEALSVS